MDMTDSDFVHLHLHSDYSLLDGMCRLEEAVEKALQLGMPALALTDHGNLYGAAKFYRLAVSAGIKPLLGMEAYITRGSRTDRSAKQSAKGANHIILLVKDYTGYKNLVRLSSLAFLEGFYYRPRVDYEILSRYREGLICLTACTKGEIPRALLAGDDEGAKAVLERYVDIFGSDNVFLEVQEHGIPEQRKVNRGLFQLGQELGLPLVATNDVHYLEKDDYEAHDILLCIQTNHDVNDPNRLRFKTDQLFFKTGSQMREIFKDLPEAVTNTLKVAQSCDLQFPQDRYYLPTCPVPEGYTPQQYLREQVYEGARGRFGELSTKIKERLDYELGVIEQLGFVGYFLIVADIVAFARTQSIPVGPGRGSAASSLVGYCLYITDIDPLEYGLIFERFLNPERMGLPDYDIDFADTGRGEIIRYITNRYGEESVSQIATFSVLKARAVVRDVGRVLGMPYNTVDRLAKLIPVYPPVTLDEAIENIPEMKEMYAEDKQVRRLLDLARRLEGLTRHASVHAAGVVIAPGRLYDYVPLMKTSKDEVATQYDKDIVEEFGLLKMDILGLTTLSLIERAVELIEENHGVKLDMATVALSDEPTYELISRGQCDGVFQLESSGMKDLCIRVTPEDFRELIPIVGLFRPGPLGSGMTDAFIKRKHGKEEVSYLHPKLKPILEETFGVIVYQEQVMQIVSQLGGFSMAQADILRKAISKKDAPPRLIDEQCHAFVEGAKKNRINPEVAGKIFDQIAPFAQYGFNKPHTTCYALLAYQTAYLKANYPLEFMAALLTVESGNSDKVAAYVEECRRMDITVLAPDINAGLAPFSTEDGAIRFGLAAIKNVGVGAIESVVAERTEGGAFKSLQDFTTRVDIRQCNRRVIESLIKAGAFDSLGFGRRRLFEAIDKALELGAKVARQRNSAQLSLLGGMEEEYLPDILDDCAEWNDEEMLGFEKELLGFYLSSHPLAHYERELASLGPVSIAKLAGCPNGSSQIVAGLIVAMRQIQDRRERDMAFVTLEDQSGQVEVVVFADTFARAEFILFKGTVVAVLGKLQLEEQGVKILANKVYPIEEAPLRLAKSIHMRVSRKMMADDTRMNELYELIGKNVNMGGCLVYLHLPSVDGEEETIARLSIRMRLSPSKELIGELGSLLGDEESAEVWTEATE